MRPRGLPERALHPAGYNHDRQTVLQQLPWDTVPVSHSITIATNITYTATSSSNTNRFGQNPAIFLQMFNHNDRVLPCPTFNTNSPFELDPCWWCVISLSLSFQITLMAAEFAVTCVLLKYFIYVQRSNFYNHEFPTQVLPIQIPCICPYSLRGFFDHHWFYNMLLINESLFMKTLNVRLLNVFASYAFHMCSPPSFSFSTQSFPFYSNSLTSSSVCFRVTFTRASTWA